MFSNILDIRFYQITAFTCNLTTLRSVVYFVLDFVVCLHGKFLLRRLIRWVHDFFLRRILILDVNFFKTARIRYLCHIILLFLWSYYQVYDSGEFWHVVSMAFDKFTFSGCSLRSSLDPNMLSVTYSNSCCC